MTFYCHIVWFEGSITIWDWCILGTLDESFLPYQRGEASIYKAADDAFIDVISALCYHFLVLRGKSFPRDCIVSLKDNDQFVWSCDSFRWNLQLKDICLKYWIFFLRKQERKCATTDISFEYLIKWCIAFYFICQVSNTKHKTMNSMLDAFIPEHRNKIQEACSFPSRHHTILQHHTYIKE